MTRPLTTRELQAIIRKLEDQNSALKRELENLYREARFAAERVNAAVRKASWGNNGSG